MNRATPANGAFSSPGCAAPVTVGWFRPAILLPANWRGWPPAELDAVLIHEREHARRRDPLVQWLALLNRAIFWFHPLAWWLERKLETLAEDACDAAVLRSGHDPHSYSQYLIHWAGAVNRAGARLPVCGTASHGGDLASRIQRILDWTPTRPLSRARAIAAAILCGVGLATFAACNLEQAQRPNPGQPSMNELAKRDAAQREKAAAENRALLDEAKNLTPQQAATKLASLQASPEDQNTHYQLMRYYESHSDLKGKNALILWYIEHQPGGKVRPWNINPGADRTAYDQGKRLWLAHTNRPNATPEIYDRAAAFLQGADKPQAEEILLAGRTAYPNDQRWPRLLGEHYAMALLGAAEPRTEYNVIRSFNASETQGRYAQSVRAKLERSTDGALLAQTAQWLTAWGHGPRGGIAPETLALAESIAARAVALDPTNNTVALINFRTKEIGTMEKLSGLRDLPPEQHQQLSAADRLLLVWYEMDRAWSPAGKTPNLDLTAAKARELLELARQSPDAPRSSYELFEGNFMLGKVALRKGDKKEAAKYLLAAADAPASEELRYKPMLMNFPRALIDWGERAAVAQFLERIAPKTGRARELQDWAAQIRKGENPQNMLPNMIGCAQEPC